MKIMLILADGMRPDALTHVEKAQKIIAKSKSTMAATTVMPSVTLPCHMSLFHSVDPSRHGITTNLYMPQVRPIDGLCETLKKAKKTTAFFYGWHELRDLVRPGSLSHECFFRGIEFGYLNADQYLTDEAIRFLNEHPMDFTFVYLGHPDFAGHHSGWMDEEYMESIFGCLERIEVKVNGLSNPQTVNGNTEVDNSANEAALQEVRQDLNSVKTAFKRVYEGLVAIKGDTADLLNRNAMPEKFMETLSVLKNEQQEMHKRQNEFLKRFATTEADAMQQISEKMEALSTSVRERISKPDKVRHFFIFEFVSKLSWLWLMLNMFVFGTFGAALYYTTRPDYDRMDNDLKYRYIKMEGGASPEQIEELENLFGLNRDNMKIQQVRADVEAYEDAVKKQAALVEQARLKEQAAKELDNKAKSIKGKPIRTDKQKK